MNKHFNTILGNINESGYTPKEGVVYLKVEEALGKFAKRYNNLMTPNNVLSHIIKQGNTFQSFSDRN